MSTVEQDDVRGVDLKHSSMRRRKREPSRMRMATPGANWTFWILAAFLCAIFLLGGSSQSNVPSLILLRPMAVLAAGFGIARLSAGQWYQYRYVIGLMASVLLLIVAHLVPLPPTVWQALPGREIVRDIDALAGIGNPWRPLSMVPDATWNALYALVVPIGVMVMAMQLDRRQHIHLAALLIVLIAFSGLIGLLQASGVSLRLYARTSDVAGLFSNRNHQGVLLALLFPILAVTTIAAEDNGMIKRWGRIVAISLAVITIPLILVTGSRAALIAAVLAIALTPFLAARLRSMRRDRITPRRRMIIGALVVVFSIAAIVLFVMVSARSSGIDRIGAAGTDPRYPVWQSIVSALPLYMPWGTGIGSYATVYQISEPASLLRPTYSNHAHNDYLEILFTAGLPGALLVLCALVLFAVGVKKGIAAKSPQAPFSRLGLLVIAIIALASTVDYPVRAPIMASVLAIAAVWAASYRKFGGEVDSE